MERLTIQLREKTKESIEQEASEYDGSASEYVRRLIRHGREYDGMEAQLESQKAEIAELESQLQEQEQEQLRSDIITQVQSAQGEISEVESQVEQHRQVEERIEALHERIQEIGAKTTPPWPIRWYRWFQNND